MSSFPDKITCADPDKESRNVTRLAIEGARDGILFMTCKDGQELMNSVRDIKPKLILLDAVMPQINGPDTVAQLRGAGKTKKIPVIFLTDLKKFEMKDEYKAAGIIGVIHKPINPETLADQIEEMWNNRGR